jgi:lipopolysaccharide transport system permease protein
MSLNKKSEINNKIYKPNRDIGLGFSIWKEMFSELKQSKELIIRFSLRNISARYKQSLLGVLWIFILPLFAVGTFLYLNYSGVFNIGKTTIPYPAYALLGVTIWQLFAAGIIACTGSLTEAGKLIGKINFAKESLIFSSFTQSFFEFIIRVILISVVFIIYKIVPSWTIIFVPIALIPLILLTLGIGFILATLNGIFRDTTHIVSLATTFLLFLTPVLYPPPTIEPMATLNRINPIGILVIGVRDLVIEGGITQPINFIYASVFALIFFLLSWRSFHIMEPRIAERV